MKIYMKLALILCALFLTSLTSNAFASGAVVSQSAIEPDIISRVYLGQSRAVTAVNQPESSSVREEFERGVIGRTGGQMKAHWSRLIFTGRASALEELPNDDAVIEFLNNSPNAVGYISDVSKAGSLQVILTF